jgi:hypothetical protein
LSDALWLRPSFKRLAPKAPTATENSKLKGGYAAFLGPAFWTLPELMQLVQTSMRRTPPLTMARTG